VPLVTRFAAARPGAADRGRRIHGPRLLLPVGAGLHAGGHADPLRRLPLRVVTGSASRIRAGGRGATPDSRTLAVSKPTFTDRNNEDEVTQADLWLMDVFGARCRLVEGHEFLAAEPRWIDSTHVRYVRDVWKIDASGSSDSLVVTIARSR